MFNDLKSCICKGIKENIERDTVSVDQELLDKLGRHQDQLMELERVSDVAFSTFMIL